MPPPRILLGSRRSLLRIVVGALGALAVVALLSVISLIARRRGLPGEGAVASGAPLPAPPEDLLCDIALGAPNTTWTRLQRGVGGAAGILPSTLPGVLVALADLDARLGLELDGSSPIDAVLTGDPLDPGFLVAIKLVDARRARTTLLDGDGAPFAASPLGDAGGGSPLTLLRPKRAIDRPLALALTDRGELLAARRAEDLGRLGPYVRRTLPARAGFHDAALTIEVPRAALATRIRPALEALWRDEQRFLLAQDRRMRAERGRPPDFGDPAAIVTALDGVVTRKLAVASDLERLRLTLEVSDAVATLDASLAPAPGANAARAWVDSMQIGDAAPAMALPASALVALSVRDGPAERAAFADEIERSVSSALGARLAEPARLHDAVAAWKGARGEWVALALGSEEPSLVARLAVDGEAAAARAVRSTLALAASSPFKDLGKVKVGPGDVATLERAGKPPVSIAWAADAGVLRLTGGRALDPAAPASARTLGDDPSLARFRGAVGADASTIAIVRPLRPDTPPATLAVGRRAGVAFVHAELPHAVLRDALRAQMGL